MAETETIWTDQQVAQLNAFQKCGRLHPFTCPGDKPFQPCPSRKLVATTTGWMCACGEYRQKWAHASMFNVGQLLLDGGRFDDTGLWTSGNKNDTPSAPETSTTSAS